MCLCCLLVLDLTLLYQSIYLRGIPLGGLPTIFCRHLYSEATLEVGRLEQCLDAVKIALSASEEETNVAQMRADEAHARAAGNISLKSLSFYIRDFIQ